MNMKTLHHGFTIIELMVAMTIGLLVALVVTQAYLSGLGTQQAQTGMSRAQEASRFAFDALAHAFRQAGYRDNRVDGIPSFCEGTAPPPRLMVRNGDQTTAINPAAANLSGSSVTLLNNSDVVRVRYYGEGLTSAPFTADGTITDCQGNSIPANTLVEDTYYVKADSGNDNEPTLYCYSSNTGLEAALVPGVESMQILFGEDTNSIPDTVIDRYVAANNVSNANNVRSAMIALVTRTKETPAVDRSTRNLNLFGLVYAPGGVAPTGDAGSVFSVPTDGRIRLVTTTTVALRNVCPF